MYTCISNRRFQKYIVPSKSEKSEKNIKYMTFKESDNLS